MPIPTATFTPLPLLDTAATETSLTPTATPTPVVISPVLLLAKRRKHYLTIGYVDENGAQQALVFQVDKNDVRAALVGLEVKTGRRVEYQDDEARKAGKG